MRLFAATPMRIRHPTKKRLYIVVPGGWPIRIPQIDRVADANRELVQLVFDSAWIKGLREAIARRAKEYAKLFPELIEPMGPPTSKGQYVRLLGFDPEELQSSYVPFHGAGTEGHERLVELLREMGEKEKARSERAA